MEHKAAAGGKSGGGCHGDEAAEEVVNKLVAMAFKDDSETEEQFLSASDGEGDSEEEDAKIEQWGEALSENGTGPSPDDLSHDTVTDRVSDCVGDRLSRSSEGLEAAEGGAGVGKRLGEGDGDGSKDCDTDAAEVEAAKLRKRQEEEDALTEEERQSRLEEAVKVKVEGNDAYKAGEYVEAVEHYSQGLELCPLKYVQQRSIMLSNRAACAMKEDKFEEAVKDCSKAIELQPSYIKAIARRADAYEKLEKLEDALKDHKTITELDHSQRASFFACMRLEEEIKQRNEKLKEEMLGKLKDLGNMVLRPFGLSTNNFKMDQDPNTGSYSMQFVQSPPTNGK